MVVLGHPQIRLWRLPAGVPTSPYINQITFYVHTSEEKSTSAANGPPRSSLSFLSETPIVWVYQTVTMKGQNTCKWLVIGSMSQCGKSCLGEHCKIHLARLRQGPGTQPCTGCGRVVKNRFKLCQDCGYHRTQMHIWQRGHRSFTAEFKRLATIEISI